MTHITTSSSLTGHFLLGLTKGYTGAPISKKVVVCAIQDLQKEVKRLMGETISFEVFPSDIVCEGQLEPHIHVGYVFPLTEEKPVSYWLDILTNSIQKLMHQFEQNRVMLLYSHEGVTGYKLIEQNPEAKDPGIS